MRQGKSGKEDSVSSTVEFRNWRSLCKATQSIVQTVTELVQMTNADDDEDFEEVEVEETKDEPVTALPTAYISQLAF